MNRVTAEVAEEIGVFFQHYYGHASTGQQIAQHHTGRSSAGDAARGCETLARHLSNYYIRAARFVLNHADEPPGFWREWAYLVLTRRVRRPLRFAGKIMSRSSDAFVKQFRAARRVSIPIVNVRTPDPESSLSLIKSALKEDKAPLVQWDTVRGLVHHNEAGRDEISRCSLKLRRLMLFHRLRC